MSQSRRFFIPAFAEQKPPVVIVGAVLLLSTLAIYLPAVQMMFISFVP